MNNRSDMSKGTSKAKGLSNSIAQKVEKLKQRDYTCPFCREVIKGIAAFGRHLKGHCT